jgi:PRTRC genetic system protein C
LFDIATDQANADVVEHPAEAKRGDRHRHRVTSERIRKFLSRLKEGGLNITMTIETMAREFRYDGLRLPDPNARLSVDEVRTAFSATYPEIATAAVTGPEAVGNKLVYHFTKAIGTKG